MDDKTFELRPPPPIRPLPSQADINRINAEQLLHNEVDMFSPRPVPLEPQDDDDIDDMHKFVQREDAVNAQHDADYQAYAQAAAAAAAQAAAAGAAQDAIDQARQAVYNGFTKGQKAYIEIKNLLTGGKYSQMDFDYDNSFIQLKPQELAEVQPFIYQDAASLADARGAAASGAAARGGKRKSKKYRYNNKSKKSKTNKRRRSRSNKRYRSRK